MGSITFPKDMLSNAIKAFYPADKTAENMKAQAYVMSAAANRDKDMANAEYYKAKTAEQAARNGARTPESIQSAALAGMGMSPQSPAAMDLVEAFRTGRNPMTPAKPAVELPKFNDSQIGDYSLGAVMANPQIALETLAPAVAAKERPVDQGQLAELAKRMGDFMGMNAATGDSNYQQFQAGAGQRMENEILQKAVSGQPLTPQDMAILKAGNVFNSQGINNFTGEGGQAFGVDQTNRIRMNSDDNATSRANNASSNATSRANNADSVAGAMARHTTPGASSTNNKVAEEEAAAINKIDLASVFKIEPQVPAGNQRYEQFRRVYNGAKRAGDQQAMRKLLYYAGKEGLIKYDAAGD